MSRLQRRYITTIAVLCAASLAVILYSTLRNPNRINYQLPQLAPVVQSQVDEMVIEHPRDTITLSRSGDDWFVQPGNYAADAPSARFLVNAMLDIEITDVVSVSDDPARFDLDEESRVRVTLKGGGEELRVVDVGKRAATFGHTFVGVPGDGRILQALGELRGYYDRDLDAFRDKSVFSFDPSTIDQIIVTKTVPPALPEVVRVVRADDGWARADQDSTGLVFAEATAAAAESNAALDAAGIQNALAFIADLSAYRYRYTDERLTDAWLRVETVGGGKSHTLLMYPQEGNIYPAQTSDSDYDFDMFIFQAGLVTTPFGLEPLESE